MTRRVRPMLEQTGPKLPGKSSQIYAEIQQALPLLLKGNVMSVDPSVGSNSSMPAFAIYQEGELLTSGTLNIDTSMPNWYKLKQVYRQLRNLSKQYKPDVCVYERVPVSAHGGRSQVSHATLLMASGAVIAAVDARAFVGIMPVTWKKYTDANYQKSDEQDAIYIGLAAIEMARQMSEKK